MPSRTQDLQQTNPTFDLPSAMSSSATLPVEQRDVVGGSTNSSQSSPKLKRGRLGSDASNSSNEQELDMEKQNVINDNVEGQEQNITKNEKSSLRDEKLSPTDILPALENGLAPPLSPEEITYPDGGLRAWSVVAGGFMAAICAFGMISSFGAYQTYYLTTLLPGTSSSTISWIGSTSAALTFFLTGVGGAFFDRYGATKGMTIGSSIIVIGYVILSFCTKYWQIFLVQSILIPCGMAALLMIPVGVTSQYFQQRRGLAVGILMSGASCGCICFPLVIANLPEHIGWFWTVRVIALIQLVLMVSATLLLKTRLPTRGPGALFSFEVLKDPAYACLAISTCAFSVGFFFFMFYVGGVAKQKGFGAKSPYLLIICNGASGFGRVGSGYLADKFGRFNMLCYGFFISAIAVYAWPAAQTFADFVGIAIVFGLHSGCLISLFPVCVGQIITDPSRVGISVGMLFSLQAIPTLLGPPITGAILGADPQGQVDRLAYAAAFNGSFIFIAGLLALAARLMQSKKLFVKI